MTVVARRTFVDIVSALAVLVVHPCLTVLVAGQTREDLEVGGIRMTCLTTIPFATVRTAVYPEIEIVMVRHAGRPVGIAVARRAGRRETAPGVRRLVVVLVARRAVLIVRGREDRIQARHRVTGFTQQCLVGPQ